MEKKKEKKLPKGKRIALIIVGAVLALLLIVMILGFAYMESLLSMINKVDDEPQNTMSQEEYQAFLDSMSETVDPEYTGPVLDREDVTWGSDVEDIESSDNVINILLIGQDRRGTTGRSRSDTIILVTVNKTNNVLTLTSFMRDMYVQIPGCDDNRINVPYVVGGMKLLDSTLYTNFGVNVDGNIEVDFQGFMEIVDMMGGIEVELSAEEAEYMNQNVSWDVEDGTDKVWNLKEGLNHLTGSQALSYARMRNVGNSDYERTERQRRVLSLLIEKAKDLSISELNVLMQHALPLITTDLSNAEIWDYGLELFPLLPKLEVQTMRIPADGCYEAANIEGMSVLVPELDRNRYLLWKIMQEAEQE